MDAAAAVVSDVEDEERLKPALHNPIHWFDFDAFFAEAGRVLKKGGVLAFWCYQNCRVSPECDEIIDALYADVDEHWPPERDIVDNHYHDIVSPFTELPVVEFAMTSEWTADDAINYMRTWSASRRYLAQNGVDACDRFADELRQRWGQGVRCIRWPLVLRVGRN